ncbi:MAG: copper-translocating P-type ATPase [Firmicutes bacterium]|nr:copper-translocating P-type ATPase [Bacillota bacterium]
MAGNARGGVSSMNGSVSPHDQGSSEQERELLLGRAAVFLAVSALLTVPLLADTVAQWFGWRAFFLADAKIQLVLATLAHVWGGAGLYPWAFRALRTGAGRVGALVALAVGAIFLYGVWAVFTRPEYAGVAFKVSTGALTLFLLARVLRIAQGRQRG